jgi:hypothetical protein
MLSVSIICVTSIWLSVMSDSPTGVQVIGDVHDVVYHIFIYIYIYIYIYMCVCVCARACVCVCVCDKLFFTRSFILRKFPLCMLRVCRW